MSLIDFESLGKLTAREGRAGWGQGAPHSRLSGDLSPCGGSSPTSASPRGKLECDPWSLSLHCGGRPCGAGLLLANAHPLCVQPALAERKSAVSVRRPPGSKRPASSRRTHWGSGLLLGLGAQSSPPLQSSKPTLPQLESLISSLRLPSSRTGRVPRSGSRTQGGGECTSSSSSLGLSKAPPRLAGPDSIRLPWK